MKFENSKLKYCEIIVSSNPVFIVMEWTAESMKNLVNKESRKIEPAEKLRNIPLSWIEVGSGYDVASYVRNY